MRGRESSGERESHPLLPGHSLQQDHVSGQLQTEVGRGPSHLVLSRTGHTLELSGFNSEIALLIQNHP